MIADHLAELECAEATAWMFVPSLPVAPNADRAWPELRRLTDGRLALLAYTSLQELVAGCGHHQPWIAVPAQWLVRMQRECRFETVALNMDIPAELRHRPADTEDWPGKPEDWNG